ncbi:MAG: nuclear transport factor 2 family protein [Zhongshania sp.]|uniref:nuclear transport factor 2 family protein n=1 Tax=Zhongshania sp. TaxID=1971902 RepID=UPI00260B8E2C|nr:nuclear transport factor 2 family protein [Zhongshania sp.]MDF1691476.1 nuclear transport factor 2 family protein [Zhongshania sp.]
MNMPVADLQSKITEIARHIDSGNASRAADYFAEKSTLQFSGHAPNQGVIEGLSAIRSFFQQRQDNEKLLTRHLISNLRITSTDANCFRLDYIYNVYRGQLGHALPDENFVCDVSDVFQQEDQDWKIIQREVAVIFKR